MLSELNVIASGLLGLHGYPVAAPQRVAPASAAPVAGTGATRVEAPARRPVVSGTQRPLTLHAQGSR